MKGQADLSWEFLGEFVEPFVILHDEDVVVELYILSGVASFNSRKLRAQPVNTVAAVELTLALVELVVDMVEAVGAFIRTSPSRHEASHGKAPEPCGAVDEVAVEMGQCVEVSLSRPYDRCRFRGRNFSL